MIGKNCLSCAYWDMDVEKDPCLTCTITGLYSEPYSLWEIGADYELTPVINDDIDSGSPYHLEVHKKEKKANPSKQVWILTNEWKFKNGERGTDRIVFDSYWDASKEQARLMKMVEESTTLDLEYDRYSIDSYERY